MKGIFPRIYDSERSKQKDAAPDTDNCFDLTYDENRRFLGDKGRCIDDIFDAIGKMHTCPIHPFAPTSSNTSKHIE